MSFRMDPSNLLKGLSEHKMKMKVAIKLYGDTAGKKLEMEAKQNRPWQDRTSLARQTIQGGSDWKGNKVVVYVSGNTSYFPFLELAHEKAYAVLWPTIQRMAKEIIEGMNNLLNRRG